MDHQEHSLLSQFHRFVVGKSVHGCHEGSCHVKLPDKRGAGLVYLVSGNRMTVATLQVIVFIKPSESQNQ